GRVEQLRVLRRLTEPHVEDDLLEPWERQEVGDAEVAHERRSNLATVPFAQTTRHGLRLIQLLAAAPADAHAAAVVEAAAADARRLVAASADGQHVGGVERRLALHDPAGLLDAARLHVSLDEVDPLDEDAVRLREDAQDLAGLPPLPARDHHHGVVLA